jgi:simple sugar transport system ATP-binding protein
MILRASTVGELASKLLSRRLSATVTRVFERSAYMRAAPDYLLLLWGETRSPMTVNVGTRDVVAGLKVGQRCEFEPTRIRAGEVEVLTSRAKVYRTSLRLRRAVATPDARTLSKGVSMLKSLYESSPHGPTLLSDPLFRAFAESTLAGYLRKRARPVPALDDFLGLLGRGGGFTPAGDDFTAGFTATYNFIARCRRREQVAVPIDAVTSWTVPESAAMVSYSSLGYVDEDAEGLILGTLAGDHAGSFDSMLSMASRGHTSGIDFSLGVLLAEALVSGGEDGGCALWSCIRTLCPDGLRTLYTSKAGIETNRRMQAEAPVLEAKGLTKRFGNLVAVNQVDFVLRKGEIHALLGENGAGKSTLCNVLYGYYKPEAGEVLVKGKEVKISSPKEGMRAGIGMVHQELMLIPNMSVLQNLSLTTDVRLSKPVLELGSVKGKLISMEETYGLHVDPEALVESLSVGERQRVEILKCLFIGADILLFDEPTTFLTEIETEKLFASLKRMASEGRSIVFVTHRIDEVMAIADRITVMKLGKVVANKLRSEVTQDQLAMLIVGREVMYNVQKQEVQIGAHVLQLVNVSADSDVGSHAIRDVSFELRAGEILGVAGVSGNGQRELDEVVTGMRKPKSGKVILEGNDITKDQPDVVRRSGVAHVCEEHKTGFIFDFSLKDNLVLAPFLAQMFKSGIFTDDKKLREKTRQLLKEYNVVAPSEDAPLRTLSGGNKQKFLLARELFWGPKVIVANNPTKGLDVGSAEYIRNTLMKQKAEGKAILMISADLDEILDMSDRIAVMNQGRIARIVDAKSADIRELAALMTTSAELK